MRCVKYCYLVVYNHLVYRAVYECLGPSISYLHSTSSYKLLLQLSLKLKITWLLEYPLSYTLLNITPSAFILSAARSNAALLGTSPTVTIGLSNSKSPSTL